MTFNIILEYYCTISGSLPSYFSIQTSSIMVFPPMQMIHQSRSFVLFLCNVSSSTLKTISKDNSGISIVVSILFMARISAVHKRDTDPPEFSAASASHTLMKHTVLQFWKCFMPYWFPFRCKQGATVFLSSSAAVDPRTTSGWLQHSCWIWQELSIFSHSTVFNVVPHGCAEGRHQFRMQLGHDRLTVGGQ